jgi:hypothetical protein
VRGIARTVAATFDLTFDDLAGPSRKLRLIAPRHLAMAIARKRLGHSPRGPFRPSAAFSAAAITRPFFTPSKSTEPAVERLARLTTNGASP